MFNELDHYRSFNMIDDILVEEAIRNAEVNDSLVKIRTTLDKSYTTFSDASSDEIVDYIPMDYAEQTEDGFVGMLAPMQ